MTLLLLAVGLVMLTLGAEWLVRGASSMALRFGVSPLFVGLTIVGFGTSSPEMAASVAASLRGAADIAVGNVVGSNIFNIAAILGLTAVIKPIVVRLAAVRRDLAVAFVAALLPWLAIAFDGTLPRWLGIVFVLGLVAYLVFAYRGDRAAPAPDAELAREELREAHVVPAEPAKKGRPAIDAGLVVVGLVLLVFGSRLLVDGAIEIARWAGLSERVIGLTIVAAGTSLPELVTSLVATLRGSTDIAVGNVIGSNIFNLLGILGVSAIVRPQAVSPSMLALDTPVMVLATIALLPIMMTGGRISRVEGAILLLGYAAYLALLLFGG